MIDDDCNPLIPPALLSNETTRKGIDYSRLGSSITAGWKRLERVRGGGEWIQRLSCIHVSASLTNQTRGLYTFNELIAQGPGPWKEETRKRARGGFGRMNIRVFKKARGSHSIEFQPL